MSLAAGKVLLHLTGQRHRVVEATDIYYLEAQGDETGVRLRAAGRLRDIRSLGEVLKDLGRLGFVRVHRNHAVNPGRVLEIRAGSGSLWEVRLEPPVNVVLPISRGSMPSLLAAYRPDRARTSGPRRPHSRRREPRLRSE